MGFASFHLVYTKKKRYNGYASGNADCVRRRTGLLFSPDFNQGENTL